MKQKPLTPFPSSILKFGFGFSESLAFQSETVQLGEQSEQSSSQEQQAYIFLLLKKVYLPPPPPPPLLPQKVLQPVAEGKKKKFQRGHLVL